MRHLKMKNVSPKGPCENVFPGPAGLALDVSDYSISFDSKIITINTMTRPITVYPISLVWVLYV